MKETKRRIVALALASALCVSLAACGKEDEGSEEGVYTAGTYEASAQGYGGKVTVTLTCDANKVTDVKIAGFDETESVGGAALEELAEQVKAVGNAEIDGVAGATVTSNAVRQAVRECLAEAAGESLETGAVADGTYTGKAAGYKSEIAVDVTIKDGAIADVKVASIDDTGMIGNAAVELLAEAVTETGSLGVDAVAGATVTSNGFFAAVTNAIEAAGGSAADFRNIPVEKRAAETVTLDTDIVVIGAGIAGLTTAIEAAEAGAKVLVLEKEGVFSGSTTRSEGFVMGAGTEVQKEHGVEDTAEDFYNDMYELYHDEPELDTDLLRIVADNSADNIKFLVDHGVVFEHLEAINPGMHPRNDERAHISWKNGDGLMEKVVEAAKANENISIFMNTKATEIIREGNKVIGVKATNQYGDEITVNAGATVLCAGSYGASDELMKKLNSRLVVNVAYNCGDGDGWYLAEGAGAKMIPIGFAAGAFMFQGLSWTDSAPGHPVYPVYNVCNVSSEGKRLVNEDAFTFDFGDALYDSDGDAYGWAIAGKSQTDARPDFYEAGKDKTYTGYGKTMNLAYTADTLDELAEMTGMDAEILKATIERYNASCDAGKDEEFGKAPEYMERIEAPYTALLLADNVSDGYSGCKINDKAQVIDATTEQPIEGFYAAGGCALAQVIGNRYYGCGSLIMTCGVYGRIAAQNAVDYLK